MAQAALSLMPEADFLQAALPLFSDGLVDAVEWSVDVGWAQPMPPWLTALLAAYSEQDALYGHGVHLSVLSAQHTPRQQQWLTNVHQEVRTRKYRHLSEHFGWSTTDVHSQGAPMPLPMTPQTLRLGQARMGQLAAACNCPVGLENLALSLCARDVEALPEFLDTLLEPVGGFLVLDLHNLWCQAVNFDLDPIHLLSQYPKNRVRELHVSGGHWTEAAGRPFRRDTHDDAVPAAVMDLLNVALETFAHVEVVVLERLGGTLPSAEARSAFADQFRAIRARCHQHHSTPLSLPRPTAPPPTWCDQEDLARAQRQWLNTLQGAPKIEGVLDPWLAGADPAAMETAQILAKRWLRQGQSGLASQQ